MHDRNRFWGRAQKASNLSRRKPGEVREQAKRCLIICEGSKTEPFYFRNFRSSLCIPPLYIDIPDNDIGTDPMSVVKKAKALYDMSRKEGNPYDAVFCVFDRDAHTGYSDALSRIDQLNRSRKPFFAVDSDPCFEYWILLHYCPFRQPFASSGTLSLCKSVEKELKKHLPEYEKGYRDLFAVLYPRILSAFSNAKMANLDAEKTGRSNPSTRIPVLFEKLKAFFPQEFSEKGLS